MKATKPIKDLVSDPRSGLDDVLLEMNEDYIEVKGYADTKLQALAAKYSYIDLSDTTFTDSAFNNVITFRSTVIRCKFTKSQMTGLQLPEGNFKHVRFKNCRMNLTNFRNSLFENCVFEDCELSEADFSGSQFTNVLFINCWMDKTEFSNCQNKRLEFEDCSLVNINGVSGLKGAAISQQNLIEIAPALAQIQEIIIK